jgi:hypothetical protein
LNSPTQAVAPQLDVLYQTRIQKERFQDRPEDYEAAKGKYIVSPSVLGLMRPSAVVMHPLPRVDEVRGCGVCGYLCRACVCVWWGGWVCLVGLGAARQVYLGVSVALADLAGCGSCD